MILSFTVLILLYTFVVLCRTFDKCNLWCACTLWIHLPTESTCYIRILYIMSTYYYKLVNYPLFLLPFSHLKLFPIWKVLNTVRTITTFPLFAPSWGEVGITFHPL